MKKLKRMSVIWASILLASIIIWSVIYIFLYVNIETSIKHEFSRVDQFLNRPGNILVVNVFNQKLRFNNTKHKPYDVTRLVNLKTNESIELKGIGQFIYTNRTSYCTDQFVFTTTPLIFNEFNQTQSSEFYSKIGYQIPFLQNFFDGFVNNLVEAKAKKIETAKTRYLLFDRKLRQLTQIFPDSILEGYMPSRAVFTQIDGEQMIYYVEGTWAAYSDIEKKLLVKIEGNQIRLIRDLDPVISSKSSWNLIGFTDKNLLFFQDGNGKSFKFHNIATANNKIIVIDKIPNIKNIQSYCMSLDSNDTKWVWSFKDDQNNTSTAILNLIDKSVTPVKKDSIVVSGSRQERTFVLLTLPKNADLKKSTFIYTQYVQLKAKLTELQSVKHFINFYDLTQRSHFNTNFVQHYSVNDDQYFVMSDIFESNKDPLKFKINGYKANCLVPMIIKESFIPDDYNEFPMNSLEAKFNSKSGYLTQTNASMEN